MNQMRLCRATTKSGKPCSAFATPTGLCYFHQHPERAKELGRKGGMKNRHYPLILEPTAIGPLETAEDVRAMLEQAVNDFLNRRIDARMLSALASASGALLKTIEVADIEPRMAELEEQLKAAQESAHVAKSNPAAA